MNKNECKEIGFISIFLTLIGFQNFDFRLNRVQLTNSTFVDCLVPHSRRIADKHFPLTPPCFLLGEFLATLVDRVLLVLFPLILLGLLGSLLNCCHHLGRKFGSLTIIWVCFLQLEACGNLSPHEQTSSLR